MFGFQEEIQSLRKELDAVTSAKERFVSSFSPRDCLEFVTLLLINTLIRVLRNYAHIYIVIRNKCVLFQVLEGEIFSCIRVAPTNCHSNSQALVITVCDSGLLSSPA